ncbi:RnfH family protein [Vibrio sp. MA40-2]|uniref:RnfH family protein n=1 Tax=Vibrio sp. MA40-2 TaxID=3391828 RepID=UPI0039A5D17B
MKVSVVYALANEQVWLPIELEDNATLMTAIHSSGVLNMFPSIDLDQQKVGVFGKIASLESPINEGDRVEIYRPIVWQPDIDEDDD